jgi:adenylate cyclase
MFRARYGVVVLSVALGLLGWATIRSLTGNWLPMLEDRSGDLVWRMGAERKDERRLILVDINEQSLREIGPWPWPRATQARLIEQLAKAGARQQILDIVLADARPDDAILEQVLQQHPSVLAQIFALDPGTGPSSGKPAGALDWTACPSLFPWRPVIWPPRQRWRVAWWGTSPRESRLMEWSGISLPSFAAITGLTRH